ncbi:MAG: heavy metal translocating P-type ATPase metal-binding domain-containing protein [Salibacteraceae bacterium]
MYTLLKDTGLGTYYSIEANPGQTQNEAKQTLEFLDLEEVKNSLIDFQEGTHNKITLYLPSIHCSACIWLLEKLNRLNSGVIRSDVNYVRKEVTILFDTEKLSLKELVALLEKLGYSPDLQRRNAGKSRSKHDTQLLLKLGLAGFVFGNIMLFSFPEYLNIDDQSLNGFKELFGWLNLMLAIPVLLYSDTDYLIGAWKSIRVKYLTIDVPIALGIITLFARSAYEIISGTGAGYFDSFAGLVFFLLVGKWFQSRTYSALAFDRDFKSYFPMAVAKLENGQESVCLIEDIKPGDKLRILNNQIIPADSILAKGKAAIDYSFVSGESDVVSKHEGDKLYAGGRQTSGVIEVLVTTEIKQGYLTKLWGQHIDRNTTEKQAVSSLIDKTSQWFSAGIITIAFATLFTWLYIDPSEAINAFTAVLIIACPCALALAMPFANGNVSRILGQAGFFLRNANTLETIAAANAFVFDKTGTLTSNSGNRVSYHGMPLSDYEQSVIFSMTSASSHPLSQALSKSLSSEPMPCEVQEIAGKGLQSTIDGLSFKVGSPSFCVAENDHTDGSSVHININGVHKGYFSIEKQLRRGIGSMIQSLKQIGSLHLLSGDNTSEQKLMAETFGQNEHLHFNQSPEDKLFYLKSLKTEGNTTLMFGDGLNDAGALKAADVGVAVADDVYSFSPACDAILQSSRLKDFAQILKYIKSSISIVRWSIGISLVYNIIGLSFAVQAELTPIVAAILMPLSSITVVAFVSLLTTVRAPKFD